MTATPHNEQVKQLVKAAGQPGRDFDAELPAALRELIALRSTGPVESAIADDPMLEIVVAAYRAALVAARVGGPQTFAEKLTDYRLAVEAMCLDHVERLKAIRDAAAGVR